MKHFYIFNIFILHNLMEKNPKSIREEIKNWKLQLSSWINVYILSTLLERHIRYYSALILPLLENTVIVCITCSTVN